VRRQDYDVLKAILYNCALLGPETQNRNGHPNFPAHLRGRIAHVRQLNPERGDRLLDRYGQINWA
jgi:RNA-directed DNA polymerase